MTNDRTSKLVNAKGFLLSLLELYINPYFDLVGGALKPASYLLQRALQPALLPLLSISNLTWNLKQAVLHLI